MTTLSIPSGIDFVDGEVRAGVIGYPFNINKESELGRSGYETMRKYSREKAIAVRLLNR